MTPREALKKANYFSTYENWGDVDKVDPNLILTLNALRGETGFPLLLSPVKGAVYAENTGHASASWHYIIEERNKYAMAADLFPKGSLVTTLLLALKFPFYGIGIYPYWTYTYKNQRLKGGLHLDIRDNTNVRKIWWQDNHKRYHNIDADNIDNLIMLLLTIREE